MELGSNSKQLLRLQSTLELQVSKSKLLWVLCPALRPKKQDIHTLNIYLEYLTYYITNLNIYHITRFPRFCKCHKCLIKLITWLNPRAKTYQIGTFQIYCQVELSYIYKTFLKKWKYNCSYIIVIYYIHLYIVQWWGEGFGQVKQCQLVLLESFFRVERLQLSHL